MNKAQSYCSKEILDGQFELDLETGHEIYFRWYFYDQFASEGKVEVYYELPLFRFELFNPVYLRRKPWSLKIFNNNLWKILVDVLVECNIYLFWDELPEDMTFGPLSVGNKEKSVEKLSIFLTEKNTSFQMVYVLEVNIERLSRFVLLCWFFLVILVIYIGLVESFSEGGVGVDIGHD